MSESQILNLDYYLVLEKEQQQSLQILLSNLRFLQESKQGIEEEIKQNQLLLDENIELMNENATLLESYKTYQEFFQSHTAQLNEEISAMNIKIRDSEAVLQSLDIDIEFFKEKIAYFSSSKFPDKKFQKQKSPNLKKSEPFQTSKESSSSLAKDHFRSSTFGNAQELIMDVSKKDIDQFLSLEEKKTLGRKLSITLLNEEPANSLTFEELKQNNFELMREIYEIHSESTKNDDNSKKMSCNTNESDVCDGKFSVSTSKSMTNIKNESPESSPLMKDKFLEVDMKYLNNEISYPNSLIKSWNEEVIELVKSKQKKAKILAKIQGKIKEVLPKSQRCTVWKQLIGNKNHIKKELYEKLRARLNASQLPRKTVHMIREDLLRTFPKLKVFSLKNSNFEKLFSMLQIFALYRGDIGYVQGMAYLATIIFFHFDEFETFKYFTNIVLNTRLLMILYTFDTKKIEVYFKTFLSFLEEKNPLTVIHLRNTGVDISMFLIEWFYTLYCRAFSLELTMKIWDLFLCYGEIIIIKVALAIFSLAESKAIEGRFEETIFCIRNCTFEVKEEQLLKHVYGNKLTMEKWEERFLIELKNMKKSALEG